MTTDRRAFLAGLAATPFLARESNATFTLPSDARIYVLDGQSNTVGWGSGAFTWRSAAGPANLMKQIGRFGDQNMQLIPMGLEPLHFWENNQIYGGISRHGFGISAVRHCFSQQPRDHIAIVVPVAHNNMSVLQQLGEVGGIPDAPIPTQWWDDTCARIDLALSYSPNSYIDGWFSQQLERDITIASNPADPFYADMPNAAAFTAAKQTYINTIRARYGNFKFLMGKATPVWDATPDVLAIKSEFETVLDQLAAANPLCATISTNGLAGTTGDYIHFSSAAAETLAGRHYTAWHALS